MSEKNKNTEVGFSRTAITSQAPLEKFELSNKPKLIITQKLQNQINFLHKKHGNNEWSGELITREVGTINDLGDWVIIAEDIFLADVGSPGFTGYEVDKGGFKSADVVEMYEKFPDLLEGKLKNHHIHTHHSMSAFFSGTDWSNLNDRSLVSNYFMMLIVNNANTPVAKVAFKAKKTGSKPIKLEFANNIDKLKPLSLPKEENTEVLVVMDMKIETEVPVIEDWFSERYDKVVKAVEEENSKKTTYPYYGGYSPGSYPSKTSEKSVNSGKLFDNDYYDRYDSYDREDPSHSGKTYYHMKTGRWESFPPGKEKEKKISDMTDKEWENYEKGDTKTKNEWDLRHARAMIHCILEGRIDADFSDCVQLLIKTNSANTTKDKIDTIVWDFRVGLEESFEKLFPEKSGNNAEYHSLLGKMVEYIFPYSYIPIVVNFIEEIEEEMEEIIEEMEDSLQNVSNFVM